MLSSSLTEKSAKKSKSGFKGLSRSKKHKKSNVDDIDTTNVSSTTNITTTLPTSIISSTSLLNNKSSKMKTSFQIVTNDDAKLSSPLSVVPTAENISNSKSKRKIKKKELKQKKVSEQSNMDTAIPIPATAQQPVKSKKKRGLKLHSHKTVLSGEKAVKIVTKPIFGVPLDVACNRNPSHDEVMLPAFFRHCIDYIEQYGLSSEGIYRVPGVHSQVQAVISSIDNGQEFPDIPPTSATFYHNQDVFTKHRSSHFLIGTTDINFKGKTRHLSSSYTGAKEFNSILSPKISENRGVVTPPSAGFISTAFSVKNPMASVGSCSSNAGVGAGSNDSPAKHLLPTSSLIAPNAATSVYPQSTLPHDPAVIASVIKQFLRSLPESILTKRLSNVIESLSTDTVQFYHNLSALVHQELPVSNRYLLAWIIQHMMHIIDRAGENRMTLANIIIVLSPCLGISHRLLSILLNPTPPKDFSLDLCKLDPKLPAFNPDKSNIDPSTWHWLFPHPVYLLRPYIPPLKLIHGLELPDSNEELDVELKKQESLLAHLCEEIKLGETSPGKEYLLRDVQHIITEIKRRKALTDPEAIRQEIIKQQTQLDRLHLAIAQCATIDAHSDTSSGLSQLKDTSTSGQRRRITGSDKSSKSHHHHHSHRHHNTDHLHQLTDKKIPYSDELWEVQRQITMLKRKLKQHEKLNEQQQQPQSSLTAITNSEMMGTTMATAVQEASSISPLPSSSSTTTCHSPSVLYMSGAPLIIPSVSELDQEEVLNLTLRKLAIEPSITTTMTTTTATITSTIDELNCSTTVNNNTRNGDGNTIVYSSQTTASSENDNTTLVKEATPISSSTVINQRDETNVCMTNLSETNNASLDFKSSTSKSQNNKESLNNTVMSIHDTDAPASVTTIPSSEQLPHNNNENQFDENLISCAASETQQKNSIIQAIDREVHPEFIHQTYASPRDYDEVFSRNSIKTTAPNTLLSHYLMTDSPSLPPPPDLAPKLTEFIEPSAIMFTNTNTTMMTTTSTFIQDPNQRQMMYYKARKQELIAIQADLKARIRSENAEINRLQLTTFNRISKQR
uniref:Rho-GAP domain-containing protein n=1 Tax=Trichobilharzia regenti TaxID=157069 RepID=A0AA85JFG2_TRIRE|nr:unnamed protein product [Trichobilharzia regenti]